MYSEDEIVQSVFQIDSSVHNIPQEETSVVNELVREPSSTVDLSIPQENLLTLLRAVLQAENLQANVKWPTRCCDHIMCGRWKIYVNIWNVKITR